MFCPGQVIAQSEGPGTRQNAVIWGKWNFDYRTYEDIKAVAIGERFTVALKNDGSMVLWGERVKLAPAGCWDVSEFKNIKAIAAGYSHLLALKDDGTVVAGGINPWNAHVVPEGLTAVKAIAVGEEHSLALREDGTVVAWGGNNYGQTAVPAGLSGVKSIACGGLTSFALKEDGTVVAWGSNISGAATIPHGLSGVKAIAAGGYQGVALKDDGTVVCWGENYSPELTSSLTNVVAVAVGAFHTIALKEDGTAIAWGSRFSSAATAIPENLPPVSTISAGPDGTALLFGDGRVLELGDRNFDSSLLVDVALAEGTYFSLVGQKTDGTVFVWSNDALAPYEDPDFEDVKRLVTTSSNNLFLLKEDGTLEAPWSASYWEPFTSHSGITDVAGGVEHALAVKEDGTVIAFGKNYYGECNVPADLANVVSVAAGAYHSVALKADGTIVAWGMNDYGQTTVPLGLRRAKAIAAGRTFTTALLDDGTIVVMGEDYRSTELKALRAVTAIAASGYHTIALRADGTVAFWAKDDDPVLQGAPEDLRNVKAVFAGPQTLTAIVETDLNGELPPLKPAVVTVGQFKAELTSATVVGSLSCANIETQVWFEYGSDTSYGNVTAPQTIAPAEVYLDFTEKLPLLTGETTHFRAVAQNATGIAYGEDRTATTGDPANLALGKPVFDGPIGSTEAPANLTDGSTDDLRPLVNIEGTLHMFANCWISKRAPGGYPYVIIDLQGAYEVTQIRLRNTHNGPLNNAGAKQLRIYGATEMSEQGTLVGATQILFADLDSATGADPLPVYNHTAQNGLQVRGLRYLRVVSDSPPYGNFGLNEIEVFGQPAAPPAFPSPPASTVHVAGGTITLSAAPTGTGPFTYQWRKDGVNLPSRTSNTLELDGLAINNGNYTVVAKNAAGSQESDAITVSVAPKTTVLFAKGDLVPGAGEEGSRIPAGAKWSAFGVAGINDDGQVAFLATYSDGVVSQTGIFGGDPEDLKLIAKKGDLADEEDGAVFKAFRDPIISRDGEVAFYATVEGPGISSGHNIGIWTWFQHGVHSELLCMARSGFWTSTVGGEGEHRAFTSMAYTSAGELAFTGTLKGVGINGSRDEALWCGYESAGMLVQEGEEFYYNYPVDPLKVRNFVSLMPAKGSPGTGMGRSVPSIIRSTDGLEVVDFSSGSNSRTIAIQGEPAASGYFQRFLAVTSDLESDEPAVLALTGYATPWDTEIQVLSRGEGGGGTAWRRVARLSAGAGVGEANFSAFLPPVFNGNEVAFIGTVKGKGISGSNNVGIWSYRPITEPPYSWTQREIVARKGQQAVGVTGAAYSSFTALALPGGDYPALLFTAKLAPAPKSPVKAKINSGNDEGLWAMDSTRTLRLLLREGMEIAEADNKTLRSFTVLPIVPTSPTHRRSFNNNRQIIYNAFFTDGSQAIMTIHLP